ncbi:MAG TPA: TIM44-like domain-containing protein [Kofleriaceae bacterium]
MKWAVGICVVVALGLVASVSDARPGGGQSYSGGGSYRSSSSSSYRSSSSSGGGSSDLSTGQGIAALLALGLLVVVVIVASGASRGDAWTSTRALKAVSPGGIRPIVAKDPAFSRVGFEDYVYQLYSAAQRARHDTTALNKFAPYFSAEALGSLAQRAWRVEQVVIGSLRIVNVDTDPNTGYSRFVVVIEANLTRTGGTANAVERWIFTRAPNVTSKEPQATRTFPCPSCGAPWAAGNQLNRCAHCNTAIEIGAFDWTVSQIHLDAEQNVGHTLKGTVAEVGNDFPTVVDDRAQVELMQLRQADPSVTWEALTQRLHMIYGRLNDAWNAQQLAPVRGLVTSSLLQYLQFWIDEYKRQSLANKLEQAKVTHVALAKVTRDKFYDAITVRMFADGIDYTVDRIGSVVGGARETRRAYTEYWTFIRMSSRKGKVTTSPSCPNCGAPLAISDAGSCTHCNSHVEAGEFDWVLSKIEQDDVYRG